MGFVEAVKTCFRKYFTFSGRAARSEFWFWWLFTTAVSIVFKVLEKLIEPIDSSGVSLGLVILAVGILMIVVNVALFVPTLTVTARRLHDVGRSGWWQLLGFGSAVLGGLAFCWGLSLGLSVVVMLLGGIVLFVWSVRHGTVGENRFGPDPLAPVEEMPADAAFVEK